MVGRKVKRWALNRVMEILNMTNIDFEALAQTKVVELRISGNRLTKREITDARRLTAIANAISRGFGGGRDIEVVRSYKPLLDKIGKTTKGAKALIPQGKFSYFWTDDLDNADKSVKNGKAKKDDETDAVKLAKLVGKLTKKA